MSQHYASSTSGGPNPFLNLVCIISTEDNFDALHPALPLTPTKQNHRAAMTKAKTCFCTEMCPVYGNTQETQHLMLEEVKRLSFATTN